MQIDTTIQQIKDLVANPNVQHILVTSGKNVDPDALGSALALASALEAQGKQVTVAIEEFDNSTMAFLPGVERVASAIGHKSLVISIDVGDNPISKINYNAENTKFNLVLTPSSGQVTTDQISYSYTGLNFDLIFTVDTANKKMLGDWVHHFSQELANIPLINIDHHADNSQFGTLNLVNAQQPSASLVVADLLQQLNWPTNSDMASNLLAGLVSDTAGFANRNTTADSLRRAANLIDAGADMAGIMQKIFRNMSVAALKLWGKVLSRVEVIDQHIVITEVHQSDITETGATEADQDTLGNLVNGFIPAVPQAKVGIVLKQKEDQSEIRGSLRAIDPTINVQAMAKQLNGGGHILASGFRLTNTSMAEARQKVLQVVKQQLTDQIAAPSSPSSNSTQPSFTSLPLQEEASKSADNKPHKNT